MELYKINFVVLLAAAILFSSRAQQTQPGVPTGIRPIGPGTPVVAEESGIPADGIDSIDGAAKRHVKRGALYGHYGGLYGGGYGHYGYGYGGYPYYGYGYGYGYDWPYYGGYYGGFGWPYGHGYGYYY